MIGHSRGGHFARALAARRPELVSHAVSMGADLQGMFGASAPTLLGVSAARRVVHATGRARMENCLSGHCGCPFSHDYARPFPFDDVRLTSIYSKGDGVVHWQCQIIPHADCVEVTGSHVGLIFNRKVYRTLAHALARPELLQRGGLSARTPGRPDAKRGWGLQRRALRDETPDAAIRMRYWGKARPPDDVACRSYPPPSAPHVTASGAHT